MDIYLFIFFFFFYYFSFELVTVKNNDAVPSKQSRCYSFFQYHENECYLNE